MKKFKFLPLFLLFVVSCSPKFTADFHSVTFTNITLNEVNFNVNLKIYHKYILPLTISDIKYKFFANDYYIGEGDSDQEINIPKYADTLLSFPCTVKYEDLSLPLIDVIVKRKFNYEVDLDFKVKILDWTKNLQIVEKGKVY